MDVVVPAVTGELVSRFITFLINKCRSKQACLEEKLERLEQLLLRVHMVVEEAEGRNITNSRMLIKLKKLTEALYHGYHVLDAFKYKPLDEIKTEEEVSGSYAFSLTTPIKHICRITDATNSKGNNHDLERALETLETLVADMREFVILLGGCKHMFRRPYDTHLYIDIFMFNRHVEKQQIINILLERIHLDIGALNPPTVLPVNSCSRHRNRTLVAHICKDDRVRSHFTSIMHFDGAHVLSRMNSLKLMCVRTLVVIEIVSEVEDQDWEKFQLLARGMGRGSKVIIIGRLERIDRFGAIKMIHLNSLSHEEYSYLFKVLAFGSANPDYHPKLASIARELAVLFGGSLMTADACADVLQKNLNVPFWLHVLRRYHKTVENNMSMFGAHPEVLAGKGHMVDITSLASSSCHASRRLITTSCPDTDVSKRELRKVMLADLLGVSTALPKEEFEIVWRSEIYPYIKAMRTATWVKEKPQYIASPSKKRQRFDSKLSDLCN